MIHDFKTSLAKGAAGEVLLMEAWPGLERLDGRKSDFLVLATGEQLELKSDQYDMDKTENFFIEVWSDRERLKVGGPRQALSHGSSIWVYMFPKNRTMFVFDTGALVSWLAENVAVYPLINIPNRTWITAGIKVPREVLKHLYQQRTF